jgi:arabinofuranan 3-O-arabinosyltransferase
LDLGSGSHRVEAGDAGPLAVTDVTLTRGTVEAVAGAGRTLRIVDWLGDRREVQVGSGAASYLTTYENYNDGWQATLGGKKLTPLRLDGWQQGWRIPAGAGGTVKLSYEPSTTYEAGLIGGGVGVAALAGLVLWRRREAGPDEPQPAAPDAGLWLGTVALTLVGVVIAGPFALLVPALALLAWKRHALLVPIAFLALAGAGIAAATGAGSPPGASEGAFGPAAQVLALIGLFAGLVSVREPGTRPVPRASVPVPGSEAPTSPLPRRRRGENGGPGAALGTGTRSVGEAPSGEPGSSEPTGAEPPAPAPGPDRASSQTISARGPGSAPREAGAGAAGAGAGDSGAGDSGAGEVAPPTARIAFRKAGNPADDDTGRGEPR